MNKYRLLCSLVSIMTISTIFSQISTVQIGQSKYDLQTNNSIERRIVVDPTTKNLTVTYTGSGKTDATFDDRGTGYAFFDGTDWKNAQGTTMTTPITSYPARPETVRIGWPNPVYVGNKEIIISHQSTGASNGLWILSRPNKGTGAWTENKSLSTGPETWPRVAQDGNNIVLISSVYQTTFNGVDGGIQIMKSTDAGVTWSNPDTIAGINIGNYPGGIGGDLYAIDLKGNTVAILTGAFDVTLYKSTNLGTSFTKTSLFPTSDNTLASNLKEISKEARSDGSYSVLIDNNNKVHCFWGKQVLEFRDVASGVTTDGFYVDIVNSLKGGIMYWNENMTTSKQPIIIPQTTFHRENAKSPMFADDKRLNFTDINQTAISYFGSGNAYGASLVTWPSTGIDASGTIYLTYGYNRGIIDTSSKGPGIDADSEGANLYDVYVVKSTNGIDWVGPLNVSNTPIGESSYPSMARFVDDNVHIVWQEDNLYGNAISTAAGGGNGTGSQIGKYTDNKMMYGKVPVIDIVNPSPSSDITPPSLSFKSNIEKSSTIENGINDSLYIEIFKGCTKDNNTLKNIQFTKQYFLDNFIDFYDNVDGYDTSKITFTDFSTVNPNNSGRYIVKVYGVDAAGNTTQRSQGVLTSGGATPTNNFLDTMKIVIDILAANADNESPVLTLLGNTTEYVYLGTTYTDAGASVSDNNPCSPTNFTKVPQTISTSTAGKYDIVFTATDNSGNQSTATRTVIVGKEATPVISNETLNVNKISASGSTSLNAEVYTNPVFTWKGKVAGTTTPSINMIVGQALNNYTVTKKMDSLCLSVVNVFQNLSGKPAGYKCVEMIFAGAAIHTINGQSFSINLYPNPNTGIFNLKFDGLNKTGKATLYIANSEGKMMNNMNLELKGNDEIMLDLSNYSKGIYFINTEIDQVNFVNKFEIK